MNTSYSTEMISTAEPAEIERFCFECAYNHPVNVYGVLYFNMYITPIILLFGVIGNIMTLIVLQSRYYSSSPTCVGLSALTMADIGVILARGMSHWLVEAYAVHLKLVSVLICKAIVYTVFVVEQLSGMFLMVTTIERFIAVWFPLKIRDWVTKKRMIVVCITVLILITGTFIPVIPATSILQYYHFTFCGWDNEYYMTVYWWFDMSLTCFLQIPIVLTGNILIMIKLVLNVSKMKAESIHVTNRKLNNSTVAMLICVGILFVLTTAPKKIYYLGLRFHLWYESGMQTAEYHAGLLAMTNLFEVLPVLGSAINFVAYLMTGKRFRSAVKSVFINTFRMKPVTTKPKETANSFGTKSTSIRSQND